MNNEKYSLYLNEVRKNLAAPGKQLLRCSTTYIPGGDLDRSSLMCSYGYTSADDQSTLFAIFLVCHISPDKFVWNEFEQLCWPEGRRAGCP